jgi:hypothetical protein
MLYFLNQNLIFMALLEHVADGVSGEGASGDVALGLAYDLDVSGCWHGSYSCVHVGKARAPQVAWPSETMGLSARQKPREFVELSGAVSRLAIAAKCRSATPAPRL